MELQGLAGRHRGGTAREAPVAAGGIPVKKPADACIFRALLVLYFLFLSIMTVLEYVTISSVVERQRAAGS